MAICCTVGVQAQQEYYPTVVTTPATCGDDNGTATVTAHGGPLPGLRPYTFVLDGISTQISNINVVVFNGLDSGLHFVTVTDAKNVGTLLEFTVDGPPPPQLVTAVNDATCQEPGSVVFSPSGGTPPFLYSVDDGRTYSPNPIFLVAVNSIIIPKIKDSFGCLAVAPSFSVPFLNDLAITAGTPPLVCEGSSVELPVSGNGLVYNWTPATGLSDPTIATPTASPTVSTLYTLEVVNGVCDTTITMDVSVNPAPLANAGEDRQTCYGKSVSLFGAGGITYQWSPATYLDSTDVASPNVVKPLTTTTYGLVVTDANGCSSLQPDEVTVTVLPPLQVIAGPDTSVTEGQPVPLFAVTPLNTGLLHYQWSPVTGLSDPVSQTPTATLATLQKITYVAEVTTADGCTGTDSVVVSVFAATDIFVPTAFSPNNDGHNDVLRPKMPGIRVFNYFTVVNRWGQQVFSTTKPEAGWDGTLNGHMVQAGVYVWMVSGVDFNGRLIQQKGTVVLVR